MAGAAGGYILFDLTVHFGVINFYSVYSQIAFLELLPVLTSLGAGVFVYRHTARRRKLQAVLTIILSFLMSHLVMYLALLLLSRFWPAYKPGG